MAFRIPLWPVVLLLVALLIAVPGCDREEPPLPDVEGLEVRLGPPSLENGGKVDTIIVSWSPARDTRVEGYAIFRAEQGVGATEAEKSEFALQAVTIATQYVDDDIRTSLRYPTMRYFYQVVVLGAQGIQGPMSAEVSIEYSGTM